jgi:hypothetical protein
MIHPGQKNGLEWGKSQLTEKSEIEVLVNGETMHFDKRWKNKQRLPSGIINGSIRGTDQRTDTVSVI